MQDVSLLQYCLLFVAATAIGFSKSGFAGVNMIHVIVFAFVFGAEASTGILLPMLVIGDICAVVFFGIHVQWHYVRRLLPPALVGVILGWLIMIFIDKRLFQPLIGVIILALTLIQAARIWRPAWFDKVPHARWFAWTLGILAGVTTMLANAAGPVVALYLLAVALPKFELVGTNAWFFLILNIFKLPFSGHLGLIYSSTLWLDLILSPAILVGMVSGRWLIRRIPQKLFDSLLLALTAIAALWLVFIRS